MSPVKRIKSLVHHIHTPHIDVAHLPAILWTEKVLSSRRFWGIVLAVVLATMFVLLVMWAASKGVGSADDLRMPFPYYGP